MPFPSTLPYGREPDILIDYQDGMKVATLLAKYQVSIAALRYLLKRRGIPRRPGGRPSGRPKPQVIVVRSPAGGPPKRIVPPELSTSPLQTSDNVVHCVCGPSTPISPPSPPDRKVSCIRTTGSPPSAWHQRKAEEAIKAREKQAATTPPVPVEDIPPFPHQRFKADGTPYPPTKKELEDWKGIQQQRAEERAAGIVPDVSVC